jgi:hypothetical protein
MSETNKLNDEPFVTVAVIDNAIEAQLVTSILKERNIPHQMRSHHDTAYDGLYQSQKGWGDLRAPHGRQTEIKQILDEIRKADK